MVSTLHLILTLALSISHVALSVPLAAPQDSEIDDPAARCMQPFQFICVDKLDLRCGMKYGGCYCTNEVPDFPLPCDSISLTATPSATPRHTKKPHPTHHHPPKFPFWPPFHPEATETLTVSASAASSTPPPRGITTRECGTRCGEPDPDFPTSTEEPAASSSTPPPVVSSSKKPTSTTKKTSSTRRGGGFPTRTVIVDPAPTRGGVIWD